MLSDSTFAERIINKYTTFGRYWLDEAALIFVREERYTNSVFAPARNLLMRFYLNWQTYRQSGQQLSINWDLVNRTITNNLKRETGAIIYSKLRKEAEELIHSKFEKESKAFIHSKIEKETEKQVLSRVREELKKTAPWAVSGMDGGRVLPQNSISALRVKYLRSHVLEAALTWEHLMGWLRQMDTNELDVLESEIRKVGVQETWKNDFLWHLTIIRQMKEDPVGGRTFANALEKQLPGHQKCLLIGENKFNSSPNQKGFFLWDWIQNMTLEETKQAIRELKGEACLDSQSLYLLQCLETAGQIKEIGIMPPDMKQDWSREKPRQILCGIQKFLTWEENKLDNSAEKIVRLFRKYEDTVYRSVKGGRRDTVLGDHRPPPIQMAAQIACVFENRSSQPDKAKETEKKLVEILLRDVYFETLKVQKEKEDQEELTEYTVKIMMTLLQKEKIRESLRTAILGTGKREEALVTQVRRTIGNDTARLLEQYFKQRRQVTGQAFGQQAGAYENTAAKEILASYFSIIKKERMLREIRPQGVIQMKNMVREKVHTSAAKEFWEKRKHLDLVMHTWNRSNQTDLGESQFAKSIRSRLAGNAHLEVQKVLALEMNTIADRDGEESQKAVTYRHTNPENQQQSLHENPVIRRETQMQVLKRKEIREEKSEETKSLVETLKSRVELQEQAIKELKQVSFSGKKLPQKSVEQIAGQVIKKMERELHLEKLRRGSC